MSELRKLAKQPGIKSVTLRTPSKHKKVSLPEEKETNIDYAYGLARQLSAERKNRNKGANATNAANNIRLEYHDVKLDYAAANNRNKSKKSPNTKKKSKSKQPPKGHNIKMNIFESN